MFEARAVGTELAQLLLFIIDVPPMLDCARKWPGPRSLSSVIWRTLVLAAVVFSVGCGSKDSADADGAPEVTDGAAPADSAQAGGDGGTAQGPGFVPNRVGHINILEGSPFWENGFGLESLEADLNDAPWVPRATEAMRHGPCAIFTHSIPGFLRSGMC